MLEKSATDTEKNIPVDQSSICAELDNDPNRQREREKERAVRIARYCETRIFRRALIFIEFMGNAIHEIKFTTNVRSGSLICD